MIFPLCSFKTDELRVLGIANIASAVFQKGNWTHVYICILSPLWRAFADLQCQLDVRDERDVHTARYVRKTMRVSGKLSEERCIRWRIFGTFFLKSYASSLQSNLQQNIQSSNVRLQWNLSPRCGLRTVNTSSNVLEPQLDVQNCVIIQWSLMCWICHSPVQNCDTIPVLRSVTVGASCNVSDPSLARTV